MAKIKKMTQTEAQEALIKSLKIHSKIKSIGEFLIIDDETSNRQQQPLDFLEPRPGFFFGEAREFAAERDEIIVAREF